MNTNNCPDSSITPYQFDTHYDCVEAGYKMAYNKFVNLEKMEDLNKDFLEEKKIVIKFECRGIINNI